MSSFWGDGFMDDPDEFDDRDDNKPTWEIGRDGLILLIDSTRPMFDNSTLGFDDETNSSPFELCMKCAKNLLMNKIISNDKDLLGIIFFGTEKQSNSSEFSCIYNFQPLDMPDANRILDVESLENGAVNFEKNYGHSYEFALSDTLWECCNMFANSAYKIAQKRVLLFTATDNPHMNDLDAQKRAFKKAKDLVELGIDLELMHLGSSFDINKFYRDIILEDDLNLLADPAQKFDELLTRVRMKDYKKRALCRLPFHLTENLLFSVGMYAPNRAAVKGSYVQVDSRTNEEVKCSTKYICFDTGQQLLPTDIKLYLEFGGSKVIFEKEEVDQIKSIVEPGFHLLGFKPMKCLKTYHHVKESSFVYPDETNIKGSTTLFSALLDSCLKKNVMPICVFKSTAGAPRMVALLPQQEEIDEHHIQLQPPGFNAIYLPFSDDIRKLKFEPHAKASEEQIDKAKEIVHRLKFKYSPDMFENPAVQKFYRGLEAFALDRDDVEEFKDLTMPNITIVDRKAGKAIQEFKELVFPVGYDSSTAGKRKAASSNAGASKKPKAELVDVDVKEVAERGNLNKLTVSVLKMFCQASKVKAASQKKADLIQAINDHFMIS